MSLFHRCSKLDTQADNTVIADLALSNNEYQRLAYGGHEVTRIEYQGKRYRYRVIRFLSEPQNGDNNQVLVTTEGSIVEEVPH